MNYYFLQTKTISITNQWREFRDETSNERAAGAGTELAGHKRGSADRQRDDLRFFESECGKRLGRRRQWRRRPYGTAVEQFVGARLQGSGRPGRRLAGVFPD